MKEMTKTEIQQRHNAILVECDQLEEGARRENRSMNEDEKNKFDALAREDSMLQMQLRGMLNDAELKAHREAQDKNALLREYIKGIKAEHRSNTVTLGAKSPADGTSITESGAIALTIKDLIDTKVEGIALPANLQLLTGVVGDVLWPLSTDDAVAAVAGEVAQIDEQALKFANLKAVSERVAVAIAVSNKAIDNADFDLIGFVTLKIRKALAILAAKRIYSHAAWADNLKGPFSLVTPGTITKDNTFAKQIAMAVATIADKGFEGEPTIVIDKVTEAELKYTPANNFNGNTDAVIKDGKLAGFNYITTGHINGELDSANNYVKSADRYIGIGYFDQLAYQQHGEVRFGIDGTSAAVQGRNSTVFTLNTDLSLTELSSKVNGNANGKPQAFALYKIVAASESNSPI